jgi:hypothetical protein
MDRSAIEEILGISKTRFFALLKQYCLDPDKFSLTYQRSTPARLPVFVEKGDREGVAFGEGLD